MYFPLIGTEYILNLYLFIAYFKRTPVFSISLALPGLVVQPSRVLTADLGVASSILARSHTFMEIDHEIISTVIFLLSTDSFTNCQLQSKVCS